MRFFLTWLLAIGMILSPALAGTDGAGDAKNTTASTTTNTTNTTTAAEKGKTGESAATASKTEAAKPAASGVESELQQLRDLIEAQTKLLQSQSEQLKEQQQRMQVLESEVNSSSARDGFVATSDSVDPDSHTAGVASTPVDGIPTGRAGGSPQLAGESPVAIHFKGITITPGGFLAAETVFRNKAVAADINTPLNSIPFSGNSGAQTTEWNSSARQSRLSMLAEGRLSNVKLSGYVETDFLGAGITSNNNESNSYVLRLRQGWGQAKFDNGWSVTGGQMWSLITETKKAVDNRSEALPLTIDPQYTVGFSWARQYGFRVAKTFGDKLTLAASVEESATTATVHGNPTITTLSTVNSVLGGGSVAGTPNPAITTPTLTTTVFNNFLIGAPGASSGLYNPTGTYAYNKTPDFVVKAALDPGWGHFEVFGVVSNFRDRAYPCYFANGGFNFPANLPGEDPANLPVNIPATTCPLTGSTNPTAGAFNDSRTGGGIGVNARVPLLHKKVEAGFHILGGDGIGRYGTSGLPDTTVRPDGTLALLRNYQVLGTLELHPTPKLDVYFNGGGEYSGRDFFTFTNLVTGATGHAGYGSPSIRNDGCSVEPLPVATPGNPPNTTAVLGSTGFIPGSLANCAGDTRIILEGTAGFWYRVYSGEKGRIQWGAQYSYVTRTAWSGSSATAGVSSQPNANDNMVFTSFRYYLP
ncbi:MAG: FlxA-like family protein [Candidatus Acidiferrales bacterium]